MGLIKGYFCFKGGLRGRRGGPSARRGGPSARRFSEFLSVSLLVPFTFVLVQIVTVKNDIVCQIRNYSRIRSVNQNLVTAQRPQPSCRNGAPGLSWIAPLLLVGASSRSSQPPSSAPSGSPLAARQVLQYRRVDQIPRLLILSAGPQPRQRQRRCAPRRGASHCDSKCGELTRQRELAHGV